MLLSSDFVNISYKYFSKIYHFHVIVVLIGPVLVKTRLCLVCVMGQNLNCILAEVYFIKTYNGAVGNNYPGNTT